MVSMPYMFQKGRDWQLLERHLSYNGDGNRVQRKLDLLQLLTSGNGFAGLPNAPHLPGGAGSADLINHLNWDWFGKEPPPPKKKFKHPVAGYPDDGHGSHPAHTGWWKNWYGEGEDILVETLTRAIEVSLGLSHGGPHQATGFTPARDWPIEFQWICPVPWFQAGIAWRQTEGSDDDAATDRHGLVTVTFLTPGNTASAHSPGVTPIMLRDLHIDPGGLGVPELDFEKDPKSSDGRRGHWIVGHRVTTPLAHKGWFSGPPATGWPDTIPSNTSAKKPPSEEREKKNYKPVVWDVTTIRPPWTEGGVHPGDIVTDPHWDY